jgi:hypothetical protein
MKQQERLSTLLSLCEGNEDAVSLIQEMWNLVEVWDDAVDGDHREPEHVVNRAFLWAICGRDENPFLLEHPELKLAMKQMVSVWMAANFLEKSKAHESLVTSYTLRCSPYLFFVSVVIAAAGVAAGAEAALLLFGDSSEDSFKAYVAEHQE